MMRNVNYCDWLTGSFYFNVVIFPLLCNSTYLYVVSFAFVDSNYNCLFLIRFQSLKIWLVWFIFFRLFVCDGLLSIFVQLRFVGFSIFPLGLCYF